MNREICDEKKKGGEWDERMKCVSLYTHNG